MFSTYTYAYSFLVCIYLCIVVPARSIAAVTLDAVQVDALSALADANPDCEKCHTLLINMDCNGADIVCIEELGATTL